ncbi:hypothetical protein KSP39_PZI002479 [Platanthera zijinensis]|uniref:Uncharacterized protein n=1 Tax=Platanthera zijinensis TaxID=2320716 RepID=A0AAP0GEM3_9ASPA
MAALLPFTFIKLPSASKRKHAETLQLITKLTTALPPPPPTRIAVEAEETPSWVLKIAGVKRAAFAWKVMQKEIFLSDISDQQNRFMIRSQVVADRIMPMMTGEEIEAANLTVSKKRRRLYNGGGEAGERKQGREHGGQGVMVYNRDGWGVGFRL